LRDVDDLDRQLISLLVADGRRTLADMAARVGLSTPAVKRRVDRLERSGTIRGYTALLSSEAMGGALEAITELRFRGDISPQEALRAVEDRPEVLSAFTVAGAADVILRLRVRDTQHLQEAINDLRRVPEIVSTRTTVILEAVIDRPSAG
jgi:Lrp/AsnC family transcriptional regulator, leucine-responsive regulatory protein